MGKRVFMCCAALCFWLAISLTAVADEPKNRAPLFDGLGKHARMVTTTSPLAQQYFDQGLAFLYAFNHDEAMRAFRQAAEIDPKCAMAHWGLAIAQGPHINNPIIPPERVKEAIRAIAKAKEHADKGTATEQALIAAAAVRYVDPQPEDRKPLDEAYAAALGEAWKKFPDDADVGAIYAEALMDLHPWELYTVDGSPQAWTPQIVDVLETVLTKSSHHPLALHLYLHAIEASANPEKADVAADRLREVAPGLGHLVHMPSHIDIRRGRWRQAIEANERAMAADARYSESVPEQEFYRLYMTHNYHMLTFAAMMQGEYRRSMDVTRAMLERIPHSWLKVEGNAAIVDAFFAMPCEVSMRFGKWDELLAEPEPDVKFPIARALWHFARGVALGATGKLIEARAEQQAFREATKAVPENARLGNNAPADVFAVAEKVLEGELLLHEGKASEALTELREAVRKEDTLRYDEPPDWIQPARHALGAALMDTGGAAEAEKAYREDLRRWPNNGWSLFGLAESLNAQGKKDEAAKVRQAFDEAWKHADTQLTASCFCRSKTN
jgi:tetratricopeptide (TPR) repeat protein